MKIYDCFPFFNELDLLEIRLNELYDTVDYFVIIEGERTHQNNPKPLYYAENKERFAKFQDKIIHIVLSAEDFNGSPAYNEAISYNAIGHALNATEAADDDIVIVGCADEIFKAEVVRKLADSYGQLTLVELHNFCYYLNTQFAEADTIWWGGPLISVKDLRSFGGQFKRCIELTRVGSSRRSSQVIDVPLPHGWHFTFMGDKTAVRSKVTSYIHKEWSHLTEEEIQSSIENLEDPYKRTGVMSFKFIGMYPVTGLPKYVQENLEKFSHLIKE